MPGRPLAAQEFNCDGVTPVAGDAITLELVSQTLDRPVDVQAPPGDFERLFVVEQRGRIRIIDLGNDSLAAQPFLNISTDASVPAQHRRVTCCGEQGLLGLAFHPDYARNGFFYVNYSRTGDGDNVIARFQVSANPDVADPATHTVVLTVEGFEGNHNAGQLAFGPLDGYLYIATGDGGSGCDPHGPVGSGQNPQSLLGKMLRIDVDGGSPYAIPASNPFPSAGDGVLDEIWALGLRNPWRFAFDTPSGDLYIGDVGQNQWEEIHYQPGTSAGGENYGWKRFEGTRLSSVSGCSTPALGPGTLTGPLVEYPHTGGAYRGCSVTGGVVYRGCRMPDLRGTYFFADYCTNWVRTLRVEGGAVVDLRDRTTELNAGLRDLVPPDVIDDISSFGVDGRGEVYICDLPTKLFRIIPVPSSNNPPTARIVTDPSPAVVTLAGGSASILLDGTTSTDGGDGPEALAYLWEKVSGPSSDAIARALKESTGVSFTQTGEYLYRLTVSDGQDTATAQASVTVNAPAPNLRRGDANGDGLYDISDAVYTLNHLFLGSPAVVPCADMLDADDDGEIVLTDAIYYLNNRFLGGPEIPAPHPDCGPDGTPGDPLGCEEPPCP